MTTNADDLVQRLREGADEFITPASAAIAMSEAADAIERRDAEIERLRAEVARLSETWMDDKGTTWRPPTAWSYAQVCRVRDEACADRDMWQSEADSRMQQQQAAERELEDMRAKWASAEARCVTLKRVERELAELRERIDRAPVVGTEVEHVDRDTTIIWLQDAPLPREYAGKRVRLVVENDPTPPQSPPR